MKILKRFFQKVKNSPECLWRYFKKKPIKATLALLLTFSFLSVASFVGYVYHHVFYNRSNLPDIRMIVNFDPPTVGTIYDKNGKIIINLAKEFRWISKPEEIPKVIRHAMLSAEDKNFYEHNGVDWMAFFFRAGIRNSVHVAENIYHGEEQIIEAQQGASTIDQQLVRLFFLQDIMRHEGSDPINKFWRKFEEWRLATWINEELKKPEYFGSKQKTKEHILACLLSYAYFRSVYGVKAASLFYFNKDIKDLGYEEAALLAGIMKNPFLYAPPSKKPLKITSLSSQKQLNRRNSILDLIVANKYLTQKTADQLKEVSLPVPSSQNINIQTNAPSVVSDVFEEIKRNNFDINKIFNGDLQVRTTINLEIQKIASQALENGLRSYEERRPKAKDKIQGSVVVLRNSDGAILAEIGGRQVFNSKKIVYSDFNRVKHSHRQPGSAFKPFVYLTALKYGWTLESIIRDAPIAVSMGSIKIDNKWVRRPPKWIANYDGKFKGFISLRKALAESRNTTAIRLARITGIDDVIQTAHLVGIKTKLEPYITTAIGASDVNLLELTNAYRALASGIYAEPYLVANLTNRSGKVLFVKNSTIRSLDINPTVLEQIQEGLRGVVRIPGGTAHSLDNKAFSIPVAGKTGTTNDSKDTLFFGWTYGSEGITVGVWVGFDNPSIGYNENGTFGTGPGRGLGSKETGGKVALPIFKEIMLSVYNNNIVGPVPQFPEKIEKNISNYLYNPQ